MSVHKEYGDHLRLWCFQLSDMALKFGYVDLKNSHRKVFEKGMKMEMMSHVKVHSLITYHILFG